MHPSLDKRLRVLKQSRKVINQIYLGIKFINSSNQNALKITFNTVHQYIIQKNVATCKKLKVEFMRFLLDLFLYYSQVEH